MSDNNDTLMLTDSETLMLRGVETASKTWTMFKKEAKWENETPNVFCTHQVGTAHKKLLFDTLQLDLKKDFPILESYGNSGSVSCPMTIALAEEQGELSKGDKLAVLGIGSGINSTVLGVEW
jgi:3-oxoacyl-[acyl-carrier-protein] synthase-3